MIYAAFKKPGKILFEKCRDKNDEKAWVQILKLARSPSRSRVSRRIQALILNQVENNNAYEIIRVKAAALP